jgi:hypothetical protein
MNFEIPLQLMEQKEQLESKRQTLIERNTELALQQAAKFYSQLDVSMVEVQLELTIQPGRRSAINICTKPRRTPEIFVGNSCRSRSGDPLAKG